MPTAPSGVLSLVTLCSQHGALGSHCPCQWLGAMRPGRDSPSKPETQGGTPVLSSGACPVGSHFWGILGAVPASSCSPDSVTCSLSQGAWGSVSFDENGLHLMCSGQQSSCWGPTTQRWARELGRTCVHKASGRAQGLAFCLALPLPCCAAGQTGPSPFLNCGVPCAK